jgi:phenylalanyl-tRNA synthetase beta chain
VIRSVEWFDTYEGEHVAAGKKSLAMHFVFAKDDRTLESAEVDALMERISLNLKEHFKAEFRG